VNLSVQKLSKSTMQGLQSCKCKRQLGTFGRSSHPLLILALQFFETHFQFS
jgi:hypothetical protein